MLKNPSKRLFVLLTSAIFIGEFIIMIAFERWLPNLSVQLSSLFDATLLILITVPLLQQFLIKPITKLFNQLQQAKDEIRINAQAFETEEGIIITDEHFKIVRVNKAFEKITGFKQHFTLGKSINQFKAKKIDTNIEHDIYLSLLKTGSWSGECNGIKVDGREFPRQMSISEVKNEQDILSGYVYIFSDITARKEHEKKIYQLAYLDPITKLPNREKLFLDIEQSFLVSEQSGEYGALIVLESDNFKVLTNANSYLVGDLFLKKIALRLLKIIPNTYRIYKIHGNEFAILLENIDPDVQTAASNARSIANLIDSSFLSAFSINEYEHRSTVSIGVALFKGHSLSTEDLLKSAEISLHHASFIDGNSTTFFDKTYSEKVAKDARLEHDLHAAIQNKELEFYYQIQVNNDIKPISAEALVRWNHPKLGLISPLEFIPLAEQSFLIIEIGNHLLDIAFQQLLKWGDNDSTKHLTLSVNVTAKQFNKPDFVSTIRELFKKYPIDPTKLTLELTESINVIDLEYVTDKMHHLKDEFHIRLSLDDFGTGYSSLIYLQNMPFDEIKIDQGFIFNIISNKNDASLVQSIIALAKIYNFEVIAEGVETKAQFDYLREIGCDNYQGYLFSKPIPIDHFQNLMTHNLSHSLH
jgi:diguanylate cyclase (GGDEF)-like protein/PAS domain S-box-containing protein